MKTLVLLLTSFFCALTVHAGEVNQANVATFNAGETASAEDVNGNFAALIAAINDNASRIAALEADGGTGGGVSNSVAGHTYFIFFLSQIHRGNVGEGIERNYQSIGHTLAKGTLTFGSDGGASLSLESNNETELGLSTGALDTPDGSLIILEGNLQAMPTENPPVSGFTQTGDTVTVGPITARVSADGMILTNADFASDQEGAGFFSESAIFVGIRIQ